eukprot:jgi/Bigna1/84717/fgenesh1_pg.239_\
MTPQQAKMTDDDDETTSDVNDDKKSPHLPPEVKVEPTNNARTSTKSMLLSRSSMTREVRKTLERTCPDFDVKEKNQWSSVIRSCLEGHRSGCERLEQREDREPKSPGTTDEVDTHQLVDKFAKPCDPSGVACSFAERPARTTTRAQVTCDNKGVVADIEYR